MVNPQQLMLYLCQPSLNPSSIKMLFQLSPYWSSILNRTTIKRENFTKSKLRFSQLSDTWQGGIWERKNCPKSKKLWWPNRKDICAWSICWQQTKQGGMDHFSLHLGFCKYIGSCVGSTLTWCDLGDQGGWANWLDKRHRYLPGQLVIGNCRGGTLLGSQHVFLFFFFWADIDRL